MKVLVTSSTGLTGKAVVEAMAARGVEVRAMVHSSKRSEEMPGIGAAEVSVGDIASKNESAILKRTPTTFREFLNRELR